MFLSKIWFILIALLAGVAVAIALVAPRPAVQKLALLEGQRLDRAQYAAEQMLKVDAHKWIDRVSKMGRDAVLADALDSASRGASGGEPGMIHKNIEERFKSLIPDLASGGIVALVAVDNKGRVLARGGEDEKEYGDYVGGAEVVADALRGYLSDDVWGANGHLVRVAAAPVLSKNRERIVGALYIGAETGTAFVERLQKNLDVDVALFLRGKLIAATGYASELGPLPEIIEQHAREIEEVKRTPALSLSEGSEQLLVVAAPFPGQAGQQQAYYALIGKKPAKSDLASLLSNTSSDDLKWGHFPWIPLVAGLLGAIAIGLFLQRIEAETPLRRLRKELQLFARGDIYKIQDGRYGGHFGGLARDMNAAIERVTHAPGPQSEMAGKDLNAILGDSAGGKAFDLPAADSSFGGSASAFGSSPSLGFSAPPLPAFAPPAPPVFAPPAPFSAAAVQAASAPPAPPPAPSESQFAWGGGESFRSASDGEATRVVAVNDDADEELHFKHIYDDFLATKKECGESTSGLTLDKFREKLRGNKSALMSKHQCRTVRFAVYVKDGKAALKATPVRD